MPTYNGTKVSDLDATTPTSGTWTVPEADDAIREIKTVIKNECKVTVPGAYPYTILSTDSYIHATGTVTVNFPQISAVSSATVRKEYVVANVGAGVITMAPYAGDTLPIATLAAGNVVVFWCNGGTTWYTKNNNAVTATNANNLYDGSTYRAASATPAANTIPIRDSLGLLSNDFNYSFKDVFRFTNTGEYSIDGSGTSNIASPYVWLNTGAVLNQHRGICQNSGYLFVIENSKKYSVEFYLSYVDPITACEVRLLSANFSVGSGMPVDTTDGEQIKILNGRIWSVNGNGSNSQTTDSSTDIPVVGSTTRPLVFRIDYVPGTNIKFYYNNTLIGTHTTYMSTYANRRISFWIKTTDTSLKQMYLGRVVIEKQY